MYRFLLIIFLYTERFLLIKTCIEISNEECESEEFRKWQNVKKILN